MTSPVAATALAGEDASTETAPESGAVTIEAITQNPDQFLGERVSVRGTLTEVFGPRTFAVADGDNGLGPLLVVSSGTDIFPDELLGNPNPTVEVLGEVRTFNRAAFESDLQHDFPDDGLAGYEGRPALVAEQVTVVEGATGTPSGDNVIGDIVASPQQYLGQQVTVGGEFGEMISTNLLRITAGSQGADGEALLVLLADDVQRPQTLTDETDIQVTGDVALFERAAFEQAYGLADVSDERFSELEGQPVLIAQNFFLMPTVSELITNTQAYLSNQVHVAGIVGSIIGPGSFGLDDPAAPGGDELLVITRAQAAAVRADEVLYVTGTVQVFDLLEAERAVGYDLEDALFADRAGRPVLIADSLTPSTPTQ